MKYILSTLALVGLASAHTTFQYFQVGGAEYDRSYIRSPPNNNPVEDVTSSNVACNVNGNTPASKKATVSAGSVFTAEFHHEGRSSQGVDPSHKGPTIAYLAKVNDALTTSAQGLSWFKIFEDGYDGSRWAVDKFNSNSGKWSFTIPRNIANGDYLLRAETIALHSASNYPGAQLYMGCAQITITGGSGGSPSTVSFPGAYSGSDPGIKMNIYSGNISYKIPGPAVYNGSGGGGNPVTTATTRPTTTAPGATTTGGSGSVPLYGQCGGSNYSGPTNCAQGNCVKINDFYSQCTP